MDSSDVELLEVLKAGLIEPTHQARLMNWRKSLAKAVMLNQTHFACLFKALELVILEEYAPVERLLIKAQREGDYRYLEKGNPFILGVLLARAYWHRRQAKLAYDLLIRFKKPHYLGERVVYSHVLDKRREELSQSIDKALVIYDELVDPQKQGVPAEMRAVALHSLGIVTRFQAYEEICKLGEQKAQFDWVAQYDKEKAFFLRAIDLSRQHGFSYAPPYARVAGLAISKWCTLKERGVGFAQKEPLMQETVSFAQKALDQSQAAVGPNRYAPALLDLAYAKYMLAEAKRDDRALEKAQKELESAVYAAPFDRVVWEQYEPYVRAVAEGQTGLEAYHNYLRARFFIPTDSMSTWLKDAIVAPDMAYVSEVNSNSLLILKKWSSYSPILTSGRSKRTYGGGYLEPIRITRSSGR